MDRRGRIEARSLFLAAGVFALLLGVVGLWSAYASRVERRLLETGRKATVTVLSKHRESQRVSPTVEVRLDEVPAEPPFFRTLLGEEFERVKPGDHLPYVYDPADPRGGLLGSAPEKGAWPCFLAAASLLVVPFVVAGFVIRRRAASAS